jgi:uncharacterized protein
MTTTTWKLSLIIGVPVIIVILYMLFAQNNALSLYSEVLKETRHILVHLPGDYETSDNRYTVLYHLDGGNRKMHSNDIPPYSGAIETLKKLNLPDQIILVGVANTNRDRDMLPVKSKRSLDGGGAHLFLTFLKDELIPHINSRYRTNGTAILYGMSDSGLFTLYALLESPRTFSAYIASSPTIGWCPTLIKEKTQTMLEGESFPTTSLFIIYGENDYPLVINHVPDYARLLNKYHVPGFRWEIKVVKNAGHIPSISLYEGLTSTNITPR